MVSPDLSILVVDDDALLRTIIAAIFEKKVKVHTAASGNEAIRFLSSNPVNLIFSDVVMPDGDGIELLDWVRTQPGNIPLVLVTGQSSISKENAIAKGAHGVVAKPFRRKTLTDIATEILAVEF